MVKVFSPMSTSGTSATSAGSPSVVTTVVSFSSLPPLLEQLIARGKSIRIHSTHEMIFFIFPSVFDFSKIV